MATWQAWQLRIVQTIGLWCDEWMPKWMIGQPEQTSHPFWPEQTGILLFTEQNGTEVACLLGKVFYKLHSFWLFLVPGTEWFMMDVSTGMCQYSNYFCFAFTLFCSAQHKHSNSHKQTCVCLPVEWNEWVDWLMDGLARSTNPQICGGHVALWLSIIQQQSMVEQSWCPCVSFGPQPRHWIAWDVSSLILCVAMALVWYIRFVMIMCTITPRASVLT